MGPQVRQLSLNGAQDVCVRERVLEEVTDEDLQLWLLHLRADPWPKPSLHLPYA